MKRVLLMICSVVLVLACIFSLFACVAGVRDMLNINEYKSADAKYARDNMKVAMEGIEQLKANEEELNRISDLAGEIQQVVSGLTSAGDTSDPEPKDEQKVWRQAEKKLLTRCEKKECRMK